jgi:hypothetical protein
MVWRGRIVARIDSGRVSEMVKQAGSRSRGAFPCAAANV